MPKMSESQMPAQYAEQYNNMYKYWSFYSENNGSDCPAKKVPWALVFKRLFFPTLVEAQIADARVKPVQC